MMIPKPKAVYSAILLVFVVVMTVILVFGGIPFFGIQKTTKFAGPENEVLGLIMDHRVSDAVVIAAARRDLPGTLAFCDQGESMLCFAVGQGRLEVVRALLDMRMSPNSIGSCDPTYYYLPLIIAVDRGYTQIVILLLERGADLNKKDSSGSSALDAAKDQPNAKLRKLIEDAAVRTLPPSTSSSK